MSDLLLLMLLLFIVFGVTKSGRRSGGVIVKHDIRGMKKGSPPPTRPRVAPAPQKPPRRKSSSS